MACACWRTANWHLAANDGDYGDSSYWPPTSMARASIGVITSFDGFIRLYDRDFELIVKKRAPGGRWPFAAAFSPDGERIARRVRRDTAAVNVLSGRDRFLLFSPDTAGADNGDNLGAVAWSAATARSSTPAGHSIWTVRALRSAAGRTRAARGRRALARGAGQSRTSGRRERTGAWPTAPVIPPSGSSIPQGTRRVHREYREGVE